MEAVTCTYVCTWRARTRAKRVRYIYSTDTLRLVAWPKIIDLHVESRSA